MDYLLYLIRRWWLKRSIRLCQWRREELSRVVIREREMIAYEEHQLNQRLRELQSRHLQSRLARVNP